MPLSDHRTHSICAEIEGLESEYITAETFTYTVDTFLTLCPMTRKRRSLQSIPIPSFLHAPHRARSYSSPAMTDEPPAFLLDDDPFANLTSSAVVASIDKIFSPSASRPTSPAPVPTVAVPRSPLSPPDSVQSSYFGAVSPHVPAPLCPRGRIKPAYERLAFSSRPSLPSLDTLAHMSLAPPQKARKGKVGAGLPYEPWEVSGEDEDEDEEDASGADTPCATRPASPLRGQANAETAAESTDPDRPSSAFGSPPLSDFTFYDNISTPSLELSLASLSLESVSSQEMFPDDDFSFFPARDPHDMDHHPPPDLLLPSLCRLETDRSDKLALPTITELPVELQQAGSSVDTEMTEDGPVDSSDWSCSRGYSSNSHFGQSSGGGGYPSRRGYLPSGNGGSGGHGHGDDGDGGRRRPTRVTLSGSSTPGTSSDEEDSEEDYGQPIDRHRGMDGVTDSEDDVPLAQRIPTALEAQRSIRQKFREERDKRRRERARKAEQAAISSAPLQSGLSSSQEAALLAARQPAGRPRTRTLPSNTPRPFAPEDLARKLQDVQVAESSQPRSRPPTRARTVDDAPPAPHAPPPLPTPASPISEAASSRVLRNMRSFHRSDKRSEEAQTRPSTADATTSKLSRAFSRARSRVRGEESIPPSAWQAVPLPASSRVSLENSPPVPPLPPVQRKLSKGSYPGIVLGKTSLELERSPKPPAQLVQAAVAAANIKTQQRIFIGDMQRFNVVEIDNNTSAGDVVTMIRSQASLSGLGGQGDWMLYEVAQDFGLERPLRGYELLSDVQASWNKDKLVNMFVVKWTPLAVPLSLEAVPSSSPTHGGYVEWESKRGKWSKRWLQLRGHGLWLSKRDNGRDEVFLCTLSNFDAYSVARAYKAPKPFVFAIKSTDNLSFFENAADYLHMFSCQVRDGQKWIEKILIARSYVLHQERHVLFSSRANAAGIAPGNAAAALSRAGTRKARPAQPLVNIPPSTPVEVFEPGSLLYHK